MSTEGPLRPTSPGTPPPVGPGSPVSDAEGKYKGLNVKETPGQKFVGTGDKVTGPSIHDRKVDHHKQPGLDESYDDSMPDDEADKLFDQVQDQVSKDKPPVKPNQPDSDEKVTPPVHDHSTESDIPETSGLPVRLAKPSLDKLQNVSQEEFETNKQGIKDKLKPKLGFLDKHGAAVGLIAVGIGMTVGGSLMCAFVGPFAAPVFAGGIAVLMIGSSKAAFPVPDDIQQPKNEPKNPLDEDDKKKKSKESSESKTEGQFLAVENPVLKALANGDDLESHTPFDVPVSDDELKMLQKQLQANGQDDSEMTKLLKQAEEDIKNGEPVSKAVLDVVSHAMAKSGISAQDEALWEGTINPIFNAVEALLDPNSTVSEEERLQNYHEALKGLKASLHKMDDETLKALYGRSQAILKVAGAQRELVNIIKPLDDMLAEEIARRKQPPPVAPKPKKEPQVETDEGWENIPSLEKMLDEVDKMPVSKRRALTYFREDLSKAMDNKSLEGAPFTQKEKETLEARAIHVLTKLDAKETGQLVPKLSDTKNERVKQLLGGIVSEGSHFK